MKNEILQSLFNFQSECAEYLCSMFTLRQLGLMENYVRSCWRRILRESRFAKIPSHIASRLDGLPHSEVCTVLIMRSGREQRILISDSQGVTEKRLDTLTWEQLERVRQLLNCNFMAASVLPSQKDNVCAEYLIQYIEKLPPSENLFVA